MSEPSTFTINSFYYFFSAVPQVLGGILALFGVFVIFKIQTLKSQLLSIGQSIYDKGDNLIRTTGVIFSKEIGNTSFLFVLERGLKKNNINDLKYVIDMIDDDLDEGNIIQALHFKLYHENYCEVFDTLQSLINSTIKWSVFTACIIVFCLAVIPFGNLILKHTTIQYILFNVLIVCIILCFYGLISILKKALIEQESKSTIDK